MTLIIEEKGILDQILALLADKVADLSITRRYLSSQMRC